MLRRLEIPAYIVFLIFTFGACDEVRQHDELSNDTISYQKQEGKSDLSKSESTKEAKEVKFSKSEKVFLKTFDTISFGNNFSTIKQAFPVIKAVNPEGGSDALASEGLTESSATLNLLNREAEIEFNYKDDSLYSYYLTIEETDYETAEEVFSTLHKRYTKAYGNCEKEQVEEENRFSKTCYWNVEDRTIVMTYNINEGIISWGFQAQQLQ